MKRVLLDQGLAPATAVILRENGWDAVHVSEVELALGGIIASVSHLTTISIHILRTGLR